jgi:predicted nucleic acid-binding protein
MNIIDSSGWVEYFTNGKNAEFFSIPMRDTENLVVPTICLYEVFKLVLREISEEMALETIGPMLSGQIAELTPQLALEAARLSLIYKLAMADSIILATAQIYNAVLWTQDEHFKDIEGAKYIVKTAKHTSPRIPGIEKGNPKTRRT